jgi:hypothetical protein
MEEARNEQMQFKAAYVLNQYAVIDTDQQQEVAAMALAQDAVAQCTVPLAADSEWRGWEWE